MKLTSKLLKQLIKEELEGLKTESQWDYIGGYHPPDPKEFERKPDPKEFEREPDPEEDEEEDEEESGWSAERMSRTEPTELEKLNNKGMEKYYTSLQRESQRRRRKRK